MEHNSQIKNYQNTHAVYQNNKNETKDDESEDSNDVVEIYENFDDMNLNERLLRGIYSYGFERPSFIQQKAIVPISNGRNVIAQAQSGTGKTGTFSIGVLNRINLNKMYCQALIISPTHELAEQTFNVIRQIGNFMDINVHICIGGTDRREDIRILREGVHIVVGTPGRVYDMLRTGALKGEKIEMFILDEADEMLNINGFQDIVYDIFQEIRPDVQIGLISATLPPSVLELSQKFVRNPVKIIVKAEELTLEGIRQYYVDVDEEYKFNTICDLYKEFSITSCVIFCNSRKKVQKISYEMTKNKFPVESIDGSMSQLDRKSVMKLFRSGKIRVLITTDILARGIDVQHVSVVINYDLPKNLESYLHRIGRSGRFGRKGLAINFVSRSDVQTLRDIEKFYNTQISELPSNLKDLI